MKHRSTPYTLAILLVLLGAAVGRVRAQGQYDISFVNMVSGGANVDVFLNNIATATVAGLAYEYTTPLITRLPIDSTAMLNVKVANAGGGIGAATINKDVPVKSATEYAAVIYKVASAQKMIVLERAKTKVSKPGKSLLRVLNITTFSPATAFDIYLDSLGGTPKFPGVAAESASAFADAPGQATMLYIMRAGSSTPIAHLSVPLVASGQMTLIVSGESQDEMRVYALSGENHDGYKLPTLDGIKGGLLSSVRVVHAWWQQKSIGTGLQALDIFVNDGVVPRTIDLRYRNASEKYGPLTDSAITVKFAPHDEGSESAIYTQTIKLQRDTDYVAILTKSKEGAAAALTLGAPVGQPAGALDSFFIRVAYVSDFHPTVRLRITHASGMIDSIMLPFLTATRWYSIPRDRFKVEAFYAGDATSFYTNENDGNTAATYFTAIVMGSEKTFEIDVLNEHMPLRQEFDPSSSVPVTAGAGPAALELFAAPNPVDGRTTVHFTMPAAGRAQLTLVDPLGRVLATPLDAVVEAGSRSVDLNTTGLSAGAYLLRLQTPGAAGTGRMVVVR